MEPRVWVVKNLPADDIQRVYRFALRLAQDQHAAEEIAQETFVRAWKARREVRKTGSTLAWLYQIAANVWRDWLRRSRLPAAQTITLGNIDPAHHGSPDRIAVQQEEVKQVTRAMDALPPRQRQVLYLFSIEGLSQAQVAEILEISADAVKASLSLARQTLRRQLKRMEAGS